MTDIRRFLNSLGKLIFLALVPTLALLGIRFLADAPFDWRALLQLGLFVSVVLLIAGGCQLGADENRILQFHPGAILLILFIINIGVFYWLSGNTLLAWLLLGGIYILLLGWVTSLGSGLFLMNRVLLEGFFIALAGLLPTLLNQIETRFSTEEFFVALEMVGLIVFWIFLRGVFAFWVRGKPQNIHPAKWQIRRGWLLATLGLATLAGIIFTALEYQRSFFPPEAPGFPDISAESPFICGEALASHDVYQGSDVFQGLLKQVEANTVNAAPEYALLALGTQDQKWANEFRENILSEAETGLFTEPAGSVKYGQYLASRRAYFYPKVRDAFPGLFTPSQEQVVQDWFAAINQRTFTVEWVDWLYALAFRYWPQGPYENQENGAGLLSLLELNTLADPALSVKNQQYLADNPRGWLTHFRVTDDAAVYQPEWMENAWYQSLYTREINPTNQQLSFDWLKLLALPDGSPLRYNHLGALEYANHAYWGANLLGDDALLWLAGRALDHLAENPAWLKGQPGVENNLVSMGSSPTIGSCLLFGDSGLPTQQGPLAPDKIVFRSGWETDDLYMLLNLRFTGWHRYKATNALMQIYKGEPLVIENTSGENFNWLPTGRSLFRDKRIPRENLNGLQIAKTGLAAALYQLTGIGGPWAQDPPFYAEVTHFETTPEFDSSTTLTNDWHGWQHQRTIYFYPEGIIAIFDNSQGPEGHPAALTWHLVGDAIPEGNRIPLGLTPETGTSPEVVLLPINGSQPEIQAETPSGNLPILRVQYSAPDGENLQAATIFLFENWVGAEITLKDGIAHIIRDDNQVEIPLNEVWNE